MKLNKMQNTLSVRTFKINEINYNNLLVGDIINSSEDEINKDIEDYNVWNCDYLYYGFSFKKKGEFYELSDDKSCLGSSCYELSKINKNKFKVLKKKRNS